MAFLSLADLKNLDPYDQKGSSDIDEFGASAVDEGPETEAVKQGPGKAEVIDVKGMTRRQIFDFLDSPPQGQGGAGTWDDPQNLNAEVPDMADLRETIRAGLNAKPATCWLWLAAGVVAGAFAGWRLARAS